MEEEGSAETWLQILLLKDEYVFLVRPDDGDEDADRWALKGGTNPFYRDIQRGPPLGVLYQGRRTLSPGVR